MLHAGYFDANTITNRCYYANFQAAEVERLRFMLHEQVLLHDTYHLLVDHDIK